MKIYDEGIFLSHLEFEIAKSERFGYPFSVIAVKALNPQMHSNILLRSIIEAQIRASDLVAKKDNDTYFILLNGTTEEKTQQYLGRLVRKAVSEYEISIIAAVTSFQKGDTTNKMMDRLLNKIK
jgi:hypothetical protein